MITIAAAALVVLGFGQIAALISIFYGYMFPGIPTPVIWILGTPMFLASISMFAIAYLALEGGEEVVGVEAITLLSIYFVCEALIYWTSVGYSVFNRLKSVDSSAPIRHKLDKAAEVATERHIQYTEEHYQMLKEARDAALKAAALAEALHKRE